jgi:hypothetical protein
MDVVIAVDPGLVNFAWCVLDSRNRSVLAWKCIWLGRHDQSYMAMFAVLVAWAMDEVELQPWWPRVTHLVIESQMCKCYIAMVAWLCGWFCRQAWLLSPVHWRNLLGLLGGSYAVNKVLLVHMCTLLLAQHHPDMTNKTNDLANTILMAYAECWHSLWASDPLGLEQRLPPVRQRLAVSVLSHLSNHPSLQLH